MLSQYETPLTGSFGKLHHRLMKQILTVYFVALYQVIVLKSLNHGEVTVDLDKRHHT